MNAWEPRFIQVRKNDFSCLGACTQGINVLACGLEGLLIYFFSECLVISHERPFFFNKARMVATWTAVPLFSRCNFKTSVADKGLSSTQSKILFFSSGFILTGAPDIGRSGRDLNLSKNQSLLVVSTVVLLNLIFFRLLHRLTLERTIKALRHALLFAN